MVGNLELVVILELVQKIAPDINRQAISTYNYFSTTNWPGSRTDSVQDVNFFI